MKNNQGKLSYDKSVANSYRNLEFFKNFLWWVPFLTEIERDLLGGQQMATLRGEAVISAKREI